MTSVFALAPSAGATSTATGDRIAGNNRYGTAEAIARQPEFAGATTAILATGENFPDALAASGLAGKNTPAPIVLTQRNTYTKEAHDALKALTSLKNVIIVGGTSAVSDTVKNAVTADGFTVTRVAGNDRYETAAAIATQVGAASVGTVGGKKTALIANGENFPDALAGGPASYKNKMPILLVHPNSVPASTAKALTDLGIKHSIILGGTAAVSDATKAAIDTATGGDSERLADVNRFGTAVKVANFEIKTLGFDGKQVLLANGQNFPDALAGGPLGGDPRPILLVTPTSDPTETNAECDALSPTLEKVIALGGTAAVGANVLTDCVTAAKNTANDNGAVNGTATTRPELVSASIVETRTAAASTATRPPGTYVKYCFDEPITGAAIDATKAFLYYSAGDRFAGTQTSAPAGQTFTSGVTAADNKCAEVIFPGLNTAALAAPLTLATVDNGAVAGVGGDQNLEGDSALTPASATAAAAGVTAAPDLVSVSGFRPGPTADVTSVDFVFDQAAFNNGNVNGFHLETLAGTTANCFGPATGNSTASGQASVGGEGTTTVTVNCAEPASSVQWDATNVVRGTIDANTVGTLTGGGGSTNPLEAADVSNSGNGSAPDLVAVVFTPNAVPNADAISYLFDEAVLAGTGPGGVYLTTGLFGIYSSTGAETPMTLTASTACARSTENNAVVTCLMPAGTLSGANYVGGNVRAGAVQEVEAAGQFNGRDEVGTSPSSGPTTTAGKTDGPDLTGATINAVTSPFGNTTYSVTYAFDEDTADTADTASTVTDNAAGGNSSTGENVITRLLHIVTPDGIRLDCVSLGLPDSSTQLANRAEDVDNTVTCSSFVVSGTTTAATADQVHSAVVATVDYGAVDDEVAGGDTNPEGASLTTGTSGTPAS